MLSATAREYLEAIYNIVAEGDAVVGARLAEKFRVSSASTTEMLHRLERNGYVTLDRRTGPALTDRGIAEAEASLRRHRLAERLLTDILGMDWIAAHEEASALQRALTPAIEAAIVVRLGNPTTCPHGNPIPGSAPTTLDYLRSHRAFRLSAATPGERLRVLCVSEVVEDETALLRFLGEKGVRPGAEVVLRETFPSATGPLLLEVAGESAALDRDVAGKIWVHHEESGLADSSPADESRPTANRSVGSSS